LQAVRDTLLSRGFKVEIVGAGAQFLLVEGCVTVADNIEADPGQAFNVTGALDQISFDQIIAIGRAVRSVVPVSRVIALGGEGVSTADLLDAAEEKGGYIGVNCPRSGVYNSGYRVIHLGYGVDPDAQIPSRLAQAGIHTTLIGKVADIVANPGGDSIPCIDTAMVLKHTVAAMEQRQTGFIAANVQETDLAGHAENVERYAAVLAIADAGIGEIIKRLADKDILLVMADHGNDPTIGHNHHTREYVPLLFAGPLLKPGPIGRRDTMSDVAATVADFFHCQAPEYGASFLTLLR
jgi:phosphopentomutase